MYEDPARSRDGRSDTDTGLPWLCCTCFLSRSRTRITSVMEMGEHFCTTHSNKCTKFVPATIVGGVFKTQQTTSAVQPASNTTPPTRCEDWRARQRTFQARMSGRRCICSCGGGVVFVCTYRIAFRCHGLQLSSSIHGCSWGCIILDCSIHTRMKVAAEFGDKPDRLPCPVSVCGALLNSAAAARVVTLWRWLGGADLGFSVDRPRSISGEYPYVLYCAVPGGMRSPRSWGRNLPTYRMVDGCCGD